MPAYIAYVDSDRRFRFCNQLYKTIPGIDADNMIGRTVGDVFGAEYYRMIEAEVDAAFRGERRSFSRKFSASGATRYLQYAYIPDRGPDGSVVGFYAMITDVTERKQAQLALEREHELLDAVLETVDVGIVACDESGKLSLFNRTALDFHGALADNVSPDDWASHYQLYEPDGKTMLAKEKVPLFRALNGEPVKNQEMVIFPGSGAKRHLSASGLQLSGKNGRKLGAVVAITDVTMAKEKNAQLWQLASFDSLTDLPNRMSLYNKLGEALARSQRSRLMVAVLYLDIDRFKAINDTLGHHGGDVVLREFAQRLCASVRQTDTVARIAGDEFVIVLEGLRHPDESILVCRKILAAMDPPFEISGQARKVSTSIGVVLAGADAAEGEVLIKQADEALYHAKTQGRNTFALFRQR